MANTTTLFASLGRLIKVRLTHTAKEQKLAKQERRIIQEMGRVLPRIGYRLESVDGRANKREGVRRKRASLPRTLKCPRCDRRFSLQAHVARHLSAMHGAKGSGRRKTTDPGGVGD
jgi:uncharacterized C2H2 Zn-finger protein